MIKILANFIVLWLSICMAIDIWRISSNKTRWNILKTLAFGFTTAAIALIILTTIVILF